MLLQFVIEPMQRGDWEQVGTIYLAGIATRNATFETQAPDWQRWDAAHLSFGRLVARADSTLLGWGALNPVSNRRCYAGVAEASVYVGASHRGRGVGQALLLGLIDLSEKQGVWTLQAGIFPENLASLALLRKCGFREVGRRERIGKLDGVWRDVLLLERRSKAVGV